MLVAPKFQPETDRFAGATVREIRSLGKHARNRRATRPPQRQKDPEAVVRVRSQAFDQYGVSAPNSSTSHLPPPIRRFCGM
jgi:hypothetical protein